MTCAEGMFPRWEESSLRGVPRFLTSHPNYLWLNRLQCLNVGDVDLAICFSDDDDAGWRECLAKFLNHPVTQ